MDTFSMQAEKKLQGQCFCGRVQIRVNGALNSPVNCHCGQCRRMNGSAFTTWFSVQLDTLVLTGENALSTYHPTNNLTRQFCKFCGSHVLTLDRRYSGIAGIHAGTFDGQELPTPKAEYFVSHKASWYSPPPGSNCFGGEMGFEPLRN